MIEIEYDPWGPLSAYLRERGDADLLATVVDYTGISIEWPDNTYSHKTRIRDAMPVIRRAYNQLPDDRKGLFSQIIAKRLMKSRDVYPNDKSQLRESLNDIGWNITDEGTLTTQDIILSERFFPLGTQFDAYIEIKSLFARAKNAIMLLDGYVGAVLFLTLKSATTVPSIKILTMVSQLKADFHHEAGLFRNQFTQIDLDIRSANDFHDRFIVIDDTEYYHIGASIKDAGKKAFMISRMQDQAMVALLKQHIEAAWNKATPI
jgi:hypothetical protein